MSTMVIDGKPATARSGATVEIRDPATGELVDTVPQAGVEETRQAIDAAHAAFPAWAALLPHKRSQLLLKGASLARQHLDEVALLLTREQGKPLRDSKIEAERFIENIEFYATLAASGAIRGKHVPLSAPGAFGLVVRRPLGVVGAIIPWNFPLTLLANKIAPALAMGNTVVAKPASTTPLSTIRLVELMNEGGLPPGVLNVVVGPGNVVGAELIRHPRVRKIGFTGETQTGINVMREAAPELKHVTLELGGSDPAIVCEDADLDVAAKAVSIGRFFNAGQACLAVKRVFVAEPVADQLIEKVVARARKIKVAPGQDPASQMGPMHTRAGRDEIEKQLKEAVDRGARVLAGGKRPEGAPFESGFFFEPTVITDVPEGAKVWTEETFGPLLPIARVKDLDEAIARANESEFGLGSSIY
ncbi:MAG TPA: aldehyde dehydrogenase family protein, partial [Candidatus Limnocylindrales bacterium]|nr:aldehyde dehydrogenase family protein [Candidatus Limnocylindrales bacterium]